MQIKKMVLSGLFALLATGVSVSVAPAASAAAPERVAVVADGQAATSSSAWELVTLWSYTDAGLRACHIEGQSYADGSTGYYCSPTQYQGSTWWGLYVGP